jgi:hypothetical protein
LKLGEIDVMDKQFSTREERSAIRLRLNLVHLKIRVFFFGIDILYSYLTHPSFYRQRSCIPERMENTGSHNPGPHLFGREICAQNEFTNDK